MRVSADSVSTIADDYWRFVSETEPAKLLIAGLPCGDVQPWKFGPEDWLKRRDGARDFLRRIDSLGGNGVQHSDAVTLGMLRHELELIVEEYEAKSFLRPCLFPLGPDFLLGYLSNLYGLESEAKARTWLGVLSAIEPMLEGLKQSLILGRDEGLCYPKLTLRRAAQNVRSAFGGAAGAAILMAPFRKTRLPSDLVGQIATEAQQVVDATALPALISYADFVELELLPQARDSVATIDGPLGLEHYCAQIRRYTSLDWQPSAVHEIGLSEVGRINDEIIRCVAAAGFENDVAGFRAHLSSDPTQFLSSGEALRERIEVLSKRIDAQIPRFFSRIPRTTYGVELMPEAVAANMPPAYAQFNPADGSEGGIHWITSLPQKCPRYMHIPIALHEAWPGHLMHFAITQELEGLPAFRRYGATGYASWSEGWALYCEELGEEMGLYREPWQIYGRLEMELFRAVRLVVDTGLHAQDWSRERAIEYAKAHLALPEQTIEVEVDRYISMPAQALSYQLGKIVIKKLRNRAESELGADFSVKAFHDQFLGLGPITLPIMEQVMNDWIDRERDAVKH